MEWLISVRAYKWSEHPDFVCEDGVNKEQNRVKGLNPSLLHSRF